MKSVFTNFLFSLLVACPLLGCMDQEESAFEQQVREEDQLINNYLTDNSIQAERLNSGIYTEMLTSNDAGAAVEDESIVAIRYSLSTLNGKLIGNLPDSVAPIRFFHAQRNPNALFPRGINIAIERMRVGERYRLYLPSYHAFDSYSFGQLIPRKTIVIAEVEVVKLEHEDSIKVNNHQTMEAFILQENFVSIEELAAGVFLEILEEGTGDLPKTGSLVKVNYKGYYLDGEVFDESEENKPIEFFIGKETVIPGFEAGVSALKKGGKGRVMIPSHLGFAEGIQVIPPAIRKDFLKEYNIRDWRPYEPIIFDLELVDIQ
ncbi:MAG: FKBP-type peptidyl-prolyl cis-trans isomerase [Bacteroidota bacterium]